MNNYDIQERWYFIWIIRTVKKKMNWRFNIFTIAIEWVKRILKTMLEITLMKMTQI